MKDLVVPNAFGKELPLWGLDFETYYDKAEYSLSKMTGIEYVRDPRFKAHGVGVVEPNGDSYWVTHKDLPKFFASIDWSKVAVAAQNTAFDAFIMSEQYNALPNYYIDTLSMSRGEWGPGPRHDLDSICERLEIEGKVQGALNDVNGVRDLTCTQEGPLAYYCIQDIEQTMEVFKTLYFDRGYPEDEMHIIDLTIKTYARPLLRINASVCRAEIEEEDIRIAGLLKSDVLGNIELSDNCAAILKAKGMMGLMRSRPCFAEMLQKRGVMPPLKQKIKNGEIVEGEFTYAFAKNDIELINLLDDPRVSDLVMMWTGLKSTLRKSRAERFLAVTHNGTKSLPIPLTYCGGRTHRWSGASGSDNASEMGNRINAQNLSSGRDGRGAKLREAIVAPEGWKVVVADSAQIECRVAAYIGGETDLLDSFKRGGDPYSELATDIFGVPVAKTGQYSHLRHVGKEGELSLGFGVGKDKFFNTVQTKYGLSVDQFSENDAEMVVRHYRAKRRGIVTTWYDIEEYIAMMCGRVVDPAGEDYKMFRFYNQKVQMPNGLFIHYKNIRGLYEQDKHGQTRVNICYDFKKDPVKIYAAKMFENFVQSVARSIVAQQAIQIAKAMPIVLLVHDEIVGLAPDNEANDILQFCLNEMSTAKDWYADIPLSAEGQVSEHYVK